MRRYLADVDESKTDLIVQLKEVTYGDCSFGIALGYAIPQSVCCSCMYIVEVDECIYMFLCFQL